MCRSTAAPLLAIVGVAGTAAGVAIALVRERVDRRADARAAREAAEEQNAPGFPDSGVEASDVVRPDADEADSIDAGSGETRTGDANR